MGWLEQLPSNAFIALDIATKQKFQQRESDFQYMQQHMELAFGDAAADLVTNLREALQFASARLRDLLSRFIFVKKIR